MEPSRQELLVENGELKRRLEELQVQAKELQAANREIFTAHNAMRMNRDDLNRAQVVTHTGSWRLDVRQNKLIWSEENHRIFGIPPETPMSYETFLASVYPEDREYVDRKWTAALAGEPYDIEHRIVVGDTVKWVRERCELEFDAHGRLLGGFGTTQDITELKQKERAIKRLASFPELNPNPVLEIDRNGTFTFVNPAAHTFLKKLAPEATLQDFLPQDWPEVQHITQQTETKAVAREIRIREKVFTETIAFTEPFEVWRLYLSDITDRKQVEEALRLSHQRLDLLAETASRLLASEDPQAVVDTICRKVMEFLDCDVFFNFIRDDREDRLHLNAWAGIPEQEAQQIEWLDYGVAVCGCAARDGCRIVAEDIHTTSDGRTELVKSYGIQAYACHPLMVQGRIIGTLSFGTRTRSRFSKDELSLMQAVADQVAVAMDRKLFLEALRQTSDELEKRVRERTKELQFTVTQLQKEVLERLRTEAELSQQSKLVYDLYNQAPCGYHSLDAEGKFIQINDTELAWLGYTREGLLGKIKFSDLLTSEGRKFFQQSFLNFKERGWVKDLEYDMIRKDGTVFPVLLSATAIKDEAGNYLMSRGTVYDLTDRIQAEAALAKERQRLFQVLEQLPAYVVLLAPDYTVPYANREFIRRFGVAAEGQRCYEFLFGLDKPCEHCLTFRVLETNTFQEWEWLGPDDRTYAVFDYPFTDVDGSPLILELGLDITERKKAEQALRESEERLRLLANQLISAQEKERKRLAGELHDELGHALLTLKLSLGGIARKLPPEHENIRELLQEQVDYISHVIEEVRRLYYDLSPGDLEDLGLTKALENLIEDFGGHQPDILWQVDLPELDGRFSTTTQTIVYRLVQEALTNIGKYAEPNQVSISARDENQHVYMVIADDGRGLDLSELDRDPNRGVGLAAMRERLYFVGGSLEIWSRKGEGTKLTFTIPVLQKDEKRD